MSKKIEDFDFIDFNDEKSGSNTTIADMIALLWRNRFWFVLSVSIAMAIGVMYVRSTQKIYSRTATILIKDDKSGGGLSEAAAFQDMFSFGSNSVNNEIGILKSRSLMMKVVEQLRLENNYQIESGFKLNDLYTSSPIAVEYVDDIAQKGVFSLEVILMQDNQIVLKSEVEEVDSKGDIKKKEVITKGVLNEDITTPNGVIRIAPTFFNSEEYIGKSIFVTKGNVKEVAKAYGANLSISAPDKTSTLVDISITDVNTQRAEDVINTLISVYETSAIEDKNLILSNTLDFIKEKVKLLENDLKLIDTDIEDYKKKNSLTDISSVSSMHLQNYSKLDSEALALENQLGIAKYMREYMMDNSKQDELIPANIGINNSGIEGQIATYNEAMTRRNKLIANSSANSPVVKDIQSSLISTRTSILSAVDNLIASLNIQLSKYSSEEQKSSSKIADVSSQQKFMINIERQLKIKEELYLYLLKKQEESEIQLTTTESNCLVVDIADGSANPISPNKMQIVLICLG
ncbi:MAG: Wzz/FepE/Etk N-terminal domain-containing protein [Rikenellaceae bacterium]